jgi:iron-siderophore transport system substrate-binding protein
VLFDEGDGIDFEAVAATDPDVILAAYSGLSQSEYDTLSKIAPVVAYADAPWASDWRDMILLNGAALGLADESEALIDHLEAKISDALVKHPELDGKTAMFVTHLDIRDLSVIRFYTTNDTRVKFFADLGLSSPQSVRAASKDGQYSAQISAERVDDFADVDIIVAYGSKALFDRIRKNLLTSHMPTVRNGAVVLLDNDPVGTAANPTPLSISWVLDEYVSLLAQAARKAE